VASRGKLLQFPKRDAEEVNFKVFAQWVALGDLQKASRCLRTLFNVEMEVAEKSCQHFSKLYLENPGGVIAETMQVRQCLLQGEQNQAMALIQKVFGLSGFELIRALEAIKKLG
jgi:hypothetical protein